MKPRAAWARPALAALVFGARWPSGRRRGGAFRSSPSSPSPASWSRGGTGRSPSATGCSCAGSSCWGCSASSSSRSPGALLQLIDPTSAAASAGALDPLRVSRAGAWRALHHDPGSELADLLYLLGLGAAYITATRVSSREEGDHTVRLVAWGALLVAGTALAHQVTGQDRLFGFYRPHSASPPILSPLLNPNHLAALTGAGAILWLGLAVAADRVAARTVAVIGAVLCGVVCMQSLSRGGVAATVGASCCSWASTRAGARPTARSPGPVRRSGWGSRSGS